MATVDLYEYHNLSESPLSGMTTFAWPSGGDLGVLFRFYNETAMNSTPCT